LLALQNLNRDKPDEPIRLSMIRARFAELIAVKTQFKDKSEALFLAGLFSLLDVILDKPLAVVLDEVQTPDEVKICLLNTNSSLGSLYKMILAYEQGQWTEVALHASSLDIDYNTMSDAYVGALVWYNEITSENESEPVRPC